MSRIDLKGFGRSQEDDYDECFFGDSPTDIDNDLVEDSIDANNDETFGVDVGDTFDDLEKFSKQTESLHLDDDVPQWFSGLPTCSLSVPDASELPLPPFDFGDNSKTAPVKAHSFGEVPNYFEHFAASNGREYSLFSPAWEGSQNTNEIPSCNFAVNGTAFEFMKENEMVAAGKGNVVAMPKGAITVEELERNQIASTPKLPSLPSSSAGAVSAADLERHYLLESAKSMQPPYTPQRPMMPPSELGARAMTPFYSHGNGPVTSAAAPFPCYSQPPPPPQTFMPPVLHMVRAYLFGQVRELPPGFPPLTPELRAAAINFIPPTGPPLGLAPRFPFTPQRPGGPMCMLPPQYPRMRFQQPQPHIPQNKVHHREQQRRQQNLPSNKTLSDFALSPYAGFMSQKEKDWLVKIQLLQSAATGNTHEDDFYYSAWKEKTSASKGSKGASKGNSDEFEHLPNARAYVPPKFAGSLGRPTSSTAKYPRQLIDLSGNSPDDDEKVSMKSSASQKKLRALLLELENMSTIVIDCEDKRRALSEGPSDDAVKNELMQGIESGVNMILNYFNTDNRLQKVLLIHKGRQMFIRSLAVANEGGQLQLMQAFFAAVNYAAKKVPSDEMNISLLAGVYNTLMHFSKETVITLIRSNKFTPPLDASNNTFVVNLLVALLLCCCRSDCCLDGWFCGNTLQMLLRPKNSAALPNCNIKEYVNVDEESNFSKLDAWSCRNITGYRNSLAEKLINTLI